MRFWTMWVRVAGVVALLVATACSNRQEEQRDRNRGQCEAVAVGTSLRQVRAALAGWYESRFADCRPNWIELPGGQCPANPAQVCELRFEWFVDDPGLCDPVGAPCADYCNVRVAGAPSNLDQPICAREFLDTQLPIE